MFAPTGKPTTDPSQSDQQAGSSEQVNLQALAEEIIKLLKEELRRENERLGR